MTKETKAERSARYQQLADKEKRRMREMVDRFLGWKLPKDFRPDCYVSFDHETAERRSSWPIGTNLLHAEQAEAMFKHCIPPACFGDDDCSSAHLATCQFAERCGK